MGDGKMLFQQESGHEGCVTVFLRCEVDENHKYTEDYKKGLLAQHDNIARIKEKLTAAAATREAKPPKFVVSVLLVPKDRQSYETEQHLQLSKQFMEQVRQDFAGFEIIDGYQDLTPTQKKHLSGLEDTGSVIDTLKIGTILRNKSGRHLQMDSNTNICDWLGLYDATFGQREQADSLCASRCSMVYIAPTSKIIYSIPEKEGGQIVTALEQSLDAYCKSDEAARDKADGSTVEDKVYERVVGNAMSRIGAAIQVDVADKMHPGQVYSFYPANISDPHFKLLKYVIPSQGGSWSKNVQRDPDLYGLPSIEFGEVKYSYGLFRNLVFTFTDIPSWPTRIKDTEVSQNLTSDKKQQLFEQRIAEALKAKAIFMGLHNVPLCLCAMARFYENAKKTLSESDTKSPPKVQEIMSKLAHQFPDNPEGDSICKMLFGVDVKELYANPLRSPRLELLAKTGSELITGAATTAAPVE